MLEFPKKQYGKVSCSFQQRWFQLYSWLEYSKIVDAAFCFPCRFFGKSSAAENIFTSGGFRDWMHATGAKECLLFTHPLSTTTKLCLVGLNTTGLGNAIGEQLDSMGAQVIKNNRQYVKVLIEAMDMRLDCVLPH